MSLHLEKLTEVPPGGFRYKDPSTGRVITGPTYRDWVNAVKKHKVANNLPVTGQLEADMQEQLCLQMPPGWCVREDGASYAGGTPDGFSISQVFTGTAALVDWYLSGKKKVSRDTAQARANICGPCPFNQQPAGCSSCNQGKILGLVSKIVGGEQLDGDAKLNACTLCGCSLKAKVWLEAEVLQRHKGDAAFPDWCWMKKEAL